MIHEIFLLTDGCLWEQNKRNGTEHPHAIEVVNIETGAVRFITSGSKIAFIEGEITDPRSQAAYNKATQMSSRGKSINDRAKGKGKGKTDNAKAI